MRRPGAQEPNADFFLKPVDAEFLQLKDYRRVITHPMDLGTVETKLAERQYASASDFVDDVRLIWANARKYNPRCAASQHATHLLPTCATVQQPPFERW